MSYENILGVGALLFLAGCASASHEDAASTSASGLTNADSSSATITFTSDYHDAIVGSLVAGGTVTISYDASRLSTCRDSATGAEPGWAITAYYRVNGGAVSSINVGGLKSDPTATQSFVLSAAGDLEMWFQNTDISGCNAYDSAFGANYHFTVLASANAPGWIGDAEYVISRETCGTPPGPCDSDFHALDGGFTYDTWTRSQAAIRRAYFQVWKQGVTDFDNANLWKELDVEIHSRVGASGDFATAYVSFDQRIGNNARYAIDLSTLDPLPGGPSDSPLTSASQCPTFPVTYQGPTGADYIDADLEFYFTVNGAELRPKDGTVFHGTYENYAGLYAVCR